MRSFAPSNETSIEGCRERVTLIPQGDSRVRTWNYLRRALSDHRHPASVASHGCRRGRVSIYLVRRQQELTPLQLHRMKRTLWFILSAVVAPVAFVTLLMWMLELEVPDLTSQMLVVGATFWILIFYVPAAYRQLKHDFPKEYERDTYARRRNRADTLLGAGVIGLFFLLAQFILQAAKT